MSNFRIAFESSNMEKRSFEISNNRDTSCVTQVEESISLPDIHECKKVAVTLSEGSLSFPHRLIYEDSIGVLEENKRLKAELFNIKLQLLSYIAALIELSNEKIRRLKLEKLCHLSEKKLNEQQLQLEREKNDRETERQNLLMKKGRLEIKLKEIYEQLNGNGGDSE
ncbi:hypothetical protein WUBG_17367 [Wuchereria bancrofti]|uniref:Uncharacterized protein n=1 Tax=Wuchereria bancrofti TaxID=6293 RepID=J9E8P0_WUCBA|nr:hypothetical protein WUBG_17367 [Wuchereria bancrofti]